MQQTCMSQWFAMQEMTSHSHNKHCCNLQCNSVTVQQCTESWVKSVFITAQLHFITANMGRDIPKF